MIFQSQYYALFALIMGYPHPDSVLPPRPKKGTRSKGLPPPKK